TEREERAMQRDELFSWAFVGLIPGELRSFERLLRLRIGDRFERIRKRREGRELVASTFGDELSEIRLVIGEVLEGAARSELLPHEEERREWRREEDHRRGAELGEADGVMEAIAERAISHLIV